MCAKGVAMNWLKKQMYWLEPAAYALAFWLLFMAVKTFLEHAEGLGP
jgi:hypothetical protein